MKLRFEFGGKMIGSSMAPNETQFTGFRAQLWVKELDFGIVEALKLKTVK